MKKVILIDDNRDILAMWKMFLEKLKYEAITLDSSAKFKSHLEDTGVSDVGCIVCDESLQDGLGSSLFEYLQKKNIYTPFIIVSGYGEEEILAKISTPQKPKILKKPISLKDLKAVIDASFEEGSATF